MLGMGVVLLLAAAGMLWLLLLLYWLRLLNFWGIFSQNWIARGVAAAAALVLVLACRNIWGTGTAVILHFALFVFLTDVIYGAGKAVGKMLKREFSRCRNVYHSGVIPLAATALAMLFAFWNMGHIVETDYTVYTQKAIRPEGYRIALLSDLHYNTTMDREKLEEQCRRIQETQPDFFVLCGDLVDENTTLEELQEAFLVLGQVESSYGTFFVYGNHDRSLYREDPGYTPEQLEQAILENGIQILQDESVTCNGEVTVIGREDRSMGTRKTGEELLAGVDQENFLLLLDHQPHEYAENGSLGYDLELSGHTHAGQLWPVGWINQALRANDLNYGYGQFGTMQAIVSSGIGGWGYPLRTSGHSEFLVVQVLPEAE